jgi:hypothetical protein
MGFNKRFLPDLFSLEESRSKINSDKKFLEIYLYGADALIGPTDSFEYLKKIEREMNVKG